MVKHGPDSNPKNEAISEQDLHTLIKLIDNIRFGSITLVIQDGKVIQIERNEKIRLV